MYLAVMICEAGCYSDVYQSGWFVTHGLAVATRRLYFSGLGCEDNVRVQPAPIILCRSDRPDRIILRTVDQK